MYYTIGIIIIIMSVAMFGWGHVRPVIGKHIGSGAVYLTAGSHIEFNEISDIIKTFLDFIKIYTRSAHTHAMYHSVCILLYYMLLYYYNNSSIRTSRDSVNTMCAAVNGTRRRKYIGNNGLKKKKTG